MPTAFARLAVASRDEHDFLDESEDPYGVSLSDEAVYAYSEIPSQKVYDRIGFLIGFLATHPYFGEPYEPYYKAAMPPVACRVFFCAHYGVYYCVDAENRAINVLAIVSERKDPLKRFELP